MDTGGYRGGGTGHRELECSNLQFFSQDNLTMITLQYWTDFCLNGD